jgi:hypothetical protein
MGTIRAERLAEIEGRFVVVDAATPIGEVGELLADAVRWVVVEHARPGAVPTWSIADAVAIRWLDADTPSDTPIGLLPHLLTPALTLERTAQGIGEARWRAWRTPGRVLVVVENGRFAGLVGDPEQASTRGAEGASGESRFLRAKVETAGAEPELRTETFAPGCQHRLTVSIGPHQAGLLMAEVPVPPEAISSPQLLKVTAVAPWITSEGQLFVPEQGASSECVLDLGIPPPGIQRVTILVMSPTGLVQTATLIGETADTPTGGPLALLVDPSLWPRLAGAMPTLVADPDRIVAAVPTHQGVGAGAPDGGFDVSSTGDLEQAAKVLWEELEIDLQGLWLDRLPLDDDATVESLRKLARAGVALREDLFDRLALRVREQFAGNGPIQLVVRDPTVDLPLELFYDRPVPHPTASVLCPTAHDALRTGTCAHCEQGASSDVICPMGFWGLRRVIERRVLEPDPGAAQPLRLESGPGRARPVLEALDAALVARSARVDASAVEVLRGALRQAGIQLAEADNWTEWSMAVTGRDPVPLLIAMPHVDQTALEPMLEIGDDRLGRVDLSEKHVRLPPHPPDQPGPLVLLLGCETAAAPVAHRTMTSRFLTRGASIVVGTRMPIVAEVAPMVGAALIDAIARAGDVTFGEAVRAARCQLVADGQLVALAVVALGDGGWRLPARAATPGAA